MSWVILGGVVVGAGLGAATSAATGGDAGKGALFGAIGGGLTGGIGSLAGSAMGSAAGSVAGGAEGAFGGIGEAALTPAVGESLSASNVLGSGSLLAGAPANVGTNLTANMGEQFAQGVGSSLSGAGTSATSGILGSIPASVTQAVMKEAPGTAVDVAGSLISGGGGSKYTGPSVTDMNVADYVENKEANELGSQTWGLAAGGSVDLHDGDFILPADIVSAMGNGSTKAGAQFLDEFFGVS
jgi:hypothetical protein